MASSSLPLATREASGRKGVGVILWGWEQAKPSHSTEERNKQLYTEMCLNMLQKRQPHVLWIQIYAMRTDNIFISAIKSI